MDKIIDKAKSIRLAIFDVDGVLTNGKLLYGADGVEYKAFNVHDGQGIKFLKKTGVEIGIITACPSEIVRKRSKDLGIEHLYQVDKLKYHAYEELKEKLKLSENEIAFVGDDIPDLSVMQHVGLSIAVANARPIVQQYADWVTTAKGGKGAVREVCDFIMLAQGTYNGIVSSYLQR